MKTKTAAKKGLSALLALTMLLGLTPQWTTSARATEGGTVTYERKNPEVAILNAYTGQDASFYSKLVAESSDYRDYYNAIQLFKKNGGSGAAPTYSESVDSSETWVFDFTGTVLKGLASPERNLKVNVSASFHSRIHPHTSFNLGTKYDYSVAVSHHINVGIGGDLEGLLYPDPYNTLAVERVGDYAGDDSYITVDPYLLKNDTQTQSGSTIYYADDLKLLFYRCNPVYDGKTCTCGGSSVDSVLVTFRDTHQPQLTSVEYKVDDGSFTNKSSGVKLSAGQKLQIKLTYDEYIRFADDSAVGKGALYLDLSANGKTPGTYKAYLTELKDKYMIFSYTVPAGVDEEIASLSLNSLFRSCNLEQLFEDETFTINKDGARDDRNGYGKSRCYVTDLAGNPLAQSEVADPNLTLDTGAPKVASIRYTLGLNNSDVKAALGKTDPNDKDYADKSDLYLGVGDTLNVTIRMNEQLKGLRIGMNGANNYQLDGWDCVTATTNILDASNNPVTLSSLYFTPYQGTEEGGASTQSGATAFVMKGVTVEEGWHLASGNQIEITKVSIHKNNNTWDADLNHKFTGEVEGTVSDLAGNVLDKASVTIQSDANANPPRLDTNAPAVTAIDNSYAEEDKDGFRYGIEICDDGSGTEGIDGSFILKNGGDGKAYQYQWAVTAAADTAVTAWNTGVTGTAQTFKQTPTVYLHIRPMEDESYENLSSCTVTVKAKDYAGNEGNTTLPSSGTLAWYIDNQAPGVQAKSSGRSLNDDGSGTLTVSLSLSDLHGISAWQYAWGENATTAPTGGWKDGTVTVTKTSDAVTVSLSETVAKGESFAKYLWVKATDNAGSDAEDHNTSTPVCLGRYAYDLSKISYELTYSQGIADSARLSVKSLSNPDDGTGTLLFLVPAAEDPDYYGVFEVNADDNDVVNQTGPAGNIFSSYNYSADSWSYYQVTKANGIYTFTADADEKAYNAVHDACYGGLSGTLTVKVLSGKKQAITKDNDVITQVGDSSYTFSEDSLSLRVAGPYPKNNFDNISIAAVNADDLGKTATSTAWASGDDYYRTTLAGLSFTVSIGKDKNGWNYEDVDWANSYISFVNQGDSSKTYEVDLGPFQTSGSSSATQTVTVPEGDYANGAYAIKLCLAFASSNAVYTGDLDDYVVVDNTEPNSDFALSSVVFHGVGWSSDGGRNTAYGGENENTWTCYTAGDGEKCIYIPTIYSGRDVYSNCTLTVDSPNEAALGSFSTGTQSYSTGRYYVKIWNTAYADASVCIEATTANREENGSETGAKEQTTAQGTVTMVDGSRDYAVLHLDADQENTVAVQKVYENGRTSDIKYYTLYYDTMQITGSVSIENEQVVFTPDTNSKVAAADGASIYAYAWRSGENASNSDTIKRIEMTAQSDGTWRCALEQEYIYQIFTVNQHGCVKADSFVSQRSPWFTKSPSVSTDENLEGLTVTNKGDGTYTLTFCVRDDADPYCDTDEYTIGVSFGEGYPAQSFTLKTAKLDNNSTWTTSEISPSGIFQVEQTSYTQYKGTGGNRFICRSYAITGYYAMAAGNTMEVTVSVTDKDGLTGTVTTTYTAPDGAATYVKPQVDTMTAPTLTTDGLTLTFTQPVRPVESWAWHETDSNSTTLAKSWVGAFPISGNGTWTIEFLDIFGNTHTQTVDVGTAFTKDGTDYSMLVSLSETEETTNPVTLATSAANGTLLVYQSDGAFKKYLASVGSEEFDSSTGSYRDDSNIGARSRVTKLTESRRYYVELLDTSGTTILTLPVHVYNIVTGAPTATVYYYVEDLGQEFTASGLEDYIAQCGTEKDGTKELTVTGGVTARYTTSRHVTATNGTEHTFTPEDRGDYTFFYVDDFGNEGSAAASLPDGLKLVGNLPVLEDTQAPVVDVQVYAKRGGSYSLEAAFLGTDSEDTITKTLTGLSYVQGYSMVLKVTDASGYTIALTETEGAALAGNVLNITKAGTYQVTVTDAAGNATNITIPVPELLDNQAPVVKEAERTATTLYELNLTVSVTDKDDLGKETADIAGVGDNVIPILPAGTTKNLDGTYTYSVTENGTVLFRFRDIAGNVGSLGDSVKSLDDEPPELTVRWSPGWYDTDKDIYGASLPQEPVKTDITAHISSNKAMQNVAVRAEFGDSHDLLVNGVSQSAYTITENSDGSGKTLVTISATPERITVTYAENYETPLIFTATAPNGKSTEQRVTGPTGLIDRTAPAVTETQTKLNRSGCLTPYAMKVTLTPDENVLCEGYESDGYYNAENPLTVTYTENGTYKLRFSDKVGNVTDYPVTVSGIDSTAPTLTLTASAETGQTAKVTVTVDEDCTVTWGDNETLTFDGKGSQTASVGENGTYAFTATDAAGNTRTRMVVVGSVDNIAPTISFTKSTIYVMQGDQETLAAELGKNYEISDNVKNQTPTCSNDGSAAVNLNTPGQYTVTYTVTDAANNSTTGTRLVRVVGKDTVCLTVDGNLVIPGSTAVIQPNVEHTLALANSSEPYTVKARKGVLGEGQMKYLSGSSLSFDDNGEFTVTGTGYYTLLVTTQSRQTIRILLYVEQ